MDSASRSSMFKGIFFLVMGVIHIWSPSQSFAADDLTGFAGDWNVAVESNDGAHTTEISETWLISNNQGNMTIHICFAVLPGTPIVPRSTTIEEPTTIRDVKRAGSLLTYAAQQTACLGIAGCAKVVRIDKCELALVDDNTLQGKCTSRIEGPQLTDGSSRIQDLVETLTFKRLGPAQDDFCSLWEPFLAPAK